MVQAQFICTEIFEVIGKRKKVGKNVRLMQDNRDPIFNVAEPSASIRMILIAEAADQFTPGKTYRATFEEIE